MVEVSHREALKVRHWNLVTGTVGPGIGTPAAWMALDSSLAVQLAAVYHQKTVLDGLIVLSRDHAAKSRPNGPETAGYRKASIFSVLGAIY